jgi:hypothetical protein
LFRGRGGCRGQGEVLVKWDLDKFGSLQDIMNFWNTHVRSMKFSV